MRWWPIVMLAVVVSACGRPATNPFDRATPHERYATSLERAGLKDTALARDWFAAAERALFEPKVATTPLTNTVRHDPSRPTAYGYRLALQRGRVLRVQLNVTSESPALIFVDLFELPGSDDPPRHVASAAAGSVTLEHEIRRDGTYVLRIQPELLRGGTLTIGQTTTAALLFPVQGGSSASVRSFFLDPRDNNTRDHHGIDIFAPRHTPVVAAAGGLVTSAGSNRLGGNVVWIFDPRRGQSHYYAHLEKQAVSAGARVTAGDVIGYVGNSGNARTTPPHLHFGIYGRGEGAVDPLPFVATDQPPRGRGAPATAPAGSRGTRPRAGAGSGDNANRPPRAGT